MIENKSGKNCYRDWGPVKSLLISLFGFALLLNGCQLPRSSRPTSHEPAPVISQPLLPVPPQTAQPISGKTRVGLLLPLTGTHKELGQGLMQAAEMSLFEHGGDNIELVIEDTEDTPQTAGKAAQSLVSQGVKLIIGPVFAPQTSAAAVHARSQGIPLLSLSNDLTVAGGGVFSLGYNPVEQLQRLLEGGQLKSIGVLVPANSYGQLFRAAFSDIQKSSPLLHINFLPSYNPQVQDLSSQAAALKQTSVDALFLPEGGQRLNILVSSLLYNDIDLSRIRLLGTAAWDTPYLLRNTNLTGGWFPALPAERRKSFESRYRQQFGELPPRLASLVYDSLAMAANLARLHPDQPFRYDLLTNSRGFAGIDGLFRFLADGKVQRGYGIYEIHLEGVKVISPPPRQF